MLQSILDDVKREFSYGNMVTRIIIINVAFFVFVHLVNITLYLAGGGQPSPFFREFIHFFSMSSDWKHILTHPWVIITSMFLHEGFWHILWNMLFLYWFGRIVGDFLGNQRILPIYLLGGVAGSIIYFITANLLIYGAEGARFALGASAGVMAIVVAAGATSPDYVMRLLLIGDVKLKYIVGVLVFLDLIGIASDINTGGHFAHLGGAFFGWLFVRQLREGNDWGAPVNNLIDRIVNFFRGLFSGQQRTRSRGPRVVYRNPVKKRAARKSDTKASPEELSHQERLDAILDKIKKSGYESLSSEEKEFLFNASKE